jgi:hypothetical protein
VVSRLQKFAELVNADVRITQDGTQRADRDGAAFVDRNSHALAIRLAPQMQMTAALTLLDKASTFEGANQDLCVRKTYAPCGLRLASCIL